MNNASDNKAHTLMYGLLYPSFLGSYLFAAYTGWREYRTSGLAPWLVFLLVYFASQYVEASTTFKSGYDGLGFVCDMAELICQTLLLTTLAGSAVTGNGPLTLSWLFYLGVLVLFVLPLVSRRLDPMSTTRTGENERRALDTLAVGAVASSGLGLLGYVPIDPSVNLGWLGPALRWAVLPALGILFAIYLLLVAIRSHHKPAAAWNVIISPFWDQRWTLLIGVVIPLLTALYTIVSHYWPSKTS